jgi:SAM-dependent methyltransferase
MSESHIKKFLHVGCGPAQKQSTTAEFSLDHWQELRFDIDPNVTPDIVGTMTDMSAVEDNYVDAIYSSHNIEHLYAHEVAEALSEFNRVLKKDGFLILTCPDLQEVAKLIAADKLIEPAYTAPAGPITPLDILYGFRPSIAQGNTYMAHRCGFTESVLRGTLVANGFATVATMRRPSAFDLWAVASVSARSENELKSLAGKHFPQAR